LSRVRGEAARKAAIFLGCPKSPILDKMLNALRISVARLAQRTRTARGA
jgi:hypothetical protein